MGILNIDDGTILAPGLRFEQDPNTGLIRTAADTLGFVAGGVLLAKYSTGALASQQATVISTTTGGLAFDPSAGMGFGIAGSSTTYFLAFGGNGDKAYTSAATTGLGAFAIFRPASVANTGAGTGNLANVTLGTVALNPAGAALIGANLYVDVPSEAGAGSFADFATAYIVDAPTGGTRNYALWVDAGVSRFDGTVQHGLAGTVTGVATFQGITSGVVTLTVAAAAGTWTMTLPTGVAAAGGYQLADAAGNGVTSWTAAASLREYKNFTGEYLAPQDALNRILGTRVPLWTYKDGRGTGDHQKVYAGVVADEAPWAMHFGGAILDPISTFGHTVAAFQEHEARIAKLERQFVAAGITPEV